MGRKRTRAWKYVYFCFTGLIFLSLPNCDTLRDIRSRNEAREYLHRGDQLFCQRDYEGALREYQKVLSMSTRKPQEAEALFNLGLIYAHFAYPKRDYEKSLNLFIRILNDYPESPLVQQARIWIGVLQEHERLGQMIERSKQTVKVPDKVVPDKIVPDKVTKPAAGTEELGPAREHLLRGQKLLAQGDYEGALKENQKVLSMSTSRPPEDEALFNMGLIYAHLGNPGKDVGKSVDFFNKLIKDYPKSPLAEQAKIWVEMLKENEALYLVIQKLKQVDIEVEEKKRETAK
jgi:tetratricopeptide (TPR) repeat protein